jgi:hypothetical protein
MIVNQINSTETFQLSFEWTPADNGTYLIEISTPPLVGENFTYNNHQNTTTHVIPSPDIWTSPSSFSFYMNEGDTTTDTLTIGNEVTAEANLTYSISYAGNYQDWLSVTPETGNVSVGSSQNLDVNINTTGLIKGFYPASIVISTNDLDELTVSIPVDLQVVYNNDVGVVSVNSPIGNKIFGNYSINATVQNIGMHNQTNVIVNCTITEGVFGTFLYEDFNNLTFPPSGWTVEEKAEWARHNGDDAGGSQPEAYLYWNVIIGDYTYMDTVPTNTFGAPSLRLSFNSSIDHYTSTFDCKVYVRPDSSTPWVDITPWSNPVSTDLPATHHDVDITTSIGSDTQIRFEFDGDNYNLNDWYLDDIHIYSPTPRNPGDIIYTTETTVDILAGEQIYVEFSPIWTPTMGSYAINVTTKLPGDQDISNDIAMNAVNFFEAFGQTIIFPNPQLVDDYLNISAQTSVQLDVDQVFINITGPAGFNTINVSMINAGNNQYYHYDNYSVEGTYTFKMWLTDLDTITYSSYNEQFTIVNDSILTKVIYYDIGWNLITIPVSTDLWASDLAANITGSLSVSGWDAVNQTYKTYIVGGPPSFDFQLENAKGYFIDVTQTGSTQVNGPQVLGIAIPLEIGWNLLGWYHDYDSLASTIGSSIPGSYIVGGPPSFDFTVSQNMGLFIDTNQLSTWYG